MHQKPMSPAEISQHEYANAPKRMGVYVNEVDISGKTIVDFGCGWGGETLWLSEQGPAEVIGVDIDESALDQSRAFAGEAARFVSDISLLQDASVDFVFSTNVFEHVMDMDGVLDDLRRILRPGGALISRFGPLFYSPYGCHFYWAGLYPWSHLILGRQWLKRRIDRIRACPSNTTSWEEMGLNRITFTGFAKIVRSKFAVKRLHPIPVYGLPLVTSIPGVRRFIDLWLRHARHERRACHTGCLRDRCTTGCHARSAQRVRDDSFRDLSTRQHASREPAAASD